jgi:hypothetical protein
MARGAVYFNVSKGWRTCVKILRIKISELFANYSPWLSLGLCESFLIKYQHLITDNI